MCSKRSQALDSPGEFWKLSHWQLLGTRQTSGRSGLGSTDPALGQGEALRDASGSCQAPFPLVHGTWDFGARFSFPSPLWTHTCTLTQAPLKQIC